MRPSPAFTEPRCFFCTRWPVGERRDRVVERRGGVVEGVVAPRRQLVLVCVETCQEPAFAEGDALAVRLEFCPASRDHLLRESRLRRSDP